MKRFKKLTKFQKGSLIFVAVVIVIVVIGRIAFNINPLSKSENDNTSVIKRVIDRNITVVSYPLSYAQTWNGAINLFPENYSTLKNQLSTNTDCESVTPKMNVYYSDDYSKLMIITNKNLYSSTSDFYKAKEIVFYQSDFSNNNGELKAFKTYCSNFYMDLIAEVNAVYPNTDAVRAVVGIGSLVNMPENISGVGVYVYVFAAKDDNLILLSQTLKGDYIFTQENLDSCKSVGLTKLNSCLSKFYTGDGEQKKKIDNSVNELINLFAI